MQRVFVTCLVELILIMPLAASDGVKGIALNKSDVRTFFSTGQTFGQENSASTKSMIEKKSKKRAFFYSLLVPGLGELYQNDWKFAGWGSGLYYLAVESFLWSGHFYMKGYSSWLKEDSRSLAARNAGVDLNSRKPAQYYLNIGKYSDIYSYNDAQRRLVGTSTLYVETDANFWQWNNNKNRRKYDGLRARSDAFRNFSQYVFWGVFTNHVMSAVNSIRILRNQQRLSETKLHFDIAPSTYRSHAYDMTFGFLVKF